MIASNKICVSVPTFLRRRENAHQGLTHSRVAWKRVLVAPLSLVTPVFHNSQQFLHAYACERVDACERIDEGHLLSWCVHVCEPGGRQVGRMQAWREMLSELACALTQASLKGAATWGAVTSVLVVGYKSVAARVFRPAPFTYLLHACAALGLCCVLACSGEGLCVSLTRNHFFVANVCVCFLYA
jgi:hypothetical protein